MTLPRISGEFRVVADPDLKFLPSGKAVANVRLVANSRKKVDDQWVDDKVCWVRAVAFEKKAENIAESIEKGMLVVVEGRLHTAEYETQDGEKRTSVELMLDTIGPSLSFATAKVTGSGKRDATSSSSGGGVERSSGGGEDPWGTPPQGDEPPF